MNRPNKTDYGWDFNDYVEDLEKYCDGLEKELHESYQGYLLEVVIPNLEKKIQEQNDDLIKLHKAFEKACGYIADIGLPFEETIKNGYSVYIEFKDKEEWKEWFLLDE